LLKLFKLVQSDMIQTLQFMIA